MQVYESMLIFKYTVECDKNCSDSTIVTFTYVSFMFLCVYPVIPTKIVDYCNQE